MTYTRPSARQSSLRILLVAALNHDTNRAECPHPEGATGSPARVGFTVLGWKPDGSAFAFSVAPSFAFCAKRGSSVLWVAALAATLVRLGRTKNLSYNGHTNEPQR